MTTSYEPLRRSSPPLDVGRVLGEKFEICGILGEGVSGIVYDARRLVAPPDDRVALKILHPHLLGDEQLRGRFTREVAILKRLEGEHLCPVLDSGEIRDPRHPDSILLYMALPKVVGPSLESVAANEGPLPVPRVIDIGLQICSALSDAHRQGVIHRDLKPANVLLRDGHHAVVVDFGMAKIVTGPGGTGTTALTSHNMVFGTPEYMAPEQARGDELDARCDVYALGVILYELLAGKVPFSGPSPLNVLTAHMTVPPERLRQRVPERGVSEALDAVVDHALAKSPEHRYASADDLAAALRQARVSRGDALSVRPPGIDDVEPDAHAPTIPSPIPMISAPKPSKTTRPSETTRWTLVWIVATAIGIAVGIWLSLRAG